MRTIPLVYPSARRMPCRTKGHIEESKATGSSVLQQQQTVDLLSSDQEEGLTLVSSNIYYILYCEQHIGVKVFIKVKLLKPILCPCQVHLPLDIIRSSKAHPFGKVSLCILTLEKYRKIRLNNELGS